MTPAAIKTPRFRAVVENTFAADAARDAARFVTRLSEDATFQLGGQPPVHGRAAIEAMIAATFCAFAAVEHELVRAMEADEQDLLIYEAIVHYTFADGRVAAVPYVNVLDFADDLVRRYRIYLDLSVLAP